MDEAPGPRLHRPAAPPPGGPDPHAPRTTGDVVYAVARAAHRRTEALAEARLLLCEAEALARFALAHGLVRPGVAYPVLDDVLVVLDQPGGPRVLLVPLDKGSRDDAA